MNTEIIISVRNLVEFLRRSGDIDNRGGGSDNVMLEGSRMHRKLQQAAGPGYQSEVTLKISWKYQKRISGVTCDAIRELEDKEGSGSFARPFLDEAEVTVEGRADGVFFGDSVQDGRILTDIKDCTAPCWTIDEIKTGYRPLNRIRKPDPVHLAQAKCYAFMYAVKNDLELIRIRMTYVNLFAETLKYFYLEYTTDELRTWFSALMEEYRKWAEYTFMWQLRRTGSIRELKFPYPYRDGQKKLAADVYVTIDRQKKLFLEAPTGTGKTITTLFPSIKAMGEGKTSKIFYLTAKTITRTAAEDSIELMRSKGLLIKSIVLTARDKVCVLDKPDCNPKACKRAKGHYDRINEAVFDMMTHECSFSRETITGYADKYQVCPFEMGLDMSYFADVIIGDYNYLFDPHVYLRRFFGDNGQKKGDHVFLVDEAHNLLDRGRSMYSAELKLSDLKRIRKKVKGIYKPLYGKLCGCIKEMEKVRKSSEPGKLKEADRVFDAAAYADVELGDILTKEKISEQNGKFRQDPLYKDKKAIRDELLQFYFDLNHLILIREKLDEHYVIYANGEKDEYYIKCFCVDPSQNLSECMKRGRSTILFSATFLPIQYYKSLLGGTKEDYEVYAKSVFDASKRKLVVVKNVTSRYKDRTPEQYEAIADCIYEISGQRHGNYMVFFPSYEFLRRVADIFEIKYLGRDPATLMNYVVPAGRRRSEFFREGVWEKTGDASLMADTAFDEDFYKRLDPSGSFALMAGQPDHAVPGEDISLIRQQADMDEKLREKFLEMFETHSDSQSLLGFCILGGIFSEGIDLKSDSLIGVIVVGTGLPMVCMERELLKEYFDEKGENGFDYSYRFPGMNKVLQAAGRVIRTADDVGVIALLDGRFMTPSYRKLFPAEWKDTEETTTAQAAGVIEKFWNEWL